MTRHAKSIEVVVRGQRRRRWSSQRRLRWCTEPTSQAWSCYWSLGRKAYRLRARPNWTRRRLGRWLQPSHTQRWCGVMPDASIASWQKPLCCYPRRLAGFSQSVTGVGAWLGVLLWIERGREYGGSITAGISVIALSVTRPDERPVREALQPFLAARRFARGFIRQMTAADTDVSTLPSRCTHSEVR